MADRYTTTQTKDGVGFMSRGRLTRADAIREFRLCYKQQLLEAQAALAVPDDELDVTTHIGVYRIYNEEPVR